MEHGSLTEPQYQVLVCRGKGMTQLETARALGTTRANVSMIEHRARRKVARAKETLEAYRLTLTDHLVSVPKGTWSYDIPPLVLGEGDRLGIHIRSNMVEIVRMARSQRPACLEQGRTTRPISFVFNAAGKLRIGGPTL
jgi:Tfx family DNA-binding protein